MNRLFLGVLLLACASAPVMADEAKPKSLCIDIAEARGPFAEHDGRWIELTPEQRLFVAGIYVLLPSTPKGLPYGTKAVMATAPGLDGALIWFIDGSKACVPMPIPKELVDLIREVGDGTIHHEGDAL